MGRKQKWEDNSVSGPQGLGLGGRNLSPLAAMTFAMAALALIVGCGSQTGTNKVAAPTVSMTANPTSIAAGSTATLTVIASNANTVAVTGSDGSSYSLPGAGGTQTVSPKTTATYTATASGNGGSATAQATVTVTASTTPTPTVSINANPTSITSGSSSTLTVTATNATSVTITGSDGSSQTLAGAGGTQTVSPTTTTTYTATATGTGGSATAQATVTVTPATTGPTTVTISANPTSIGTGGSSMLTVTATNATGVLVTGSDGSSYTLQPAGGTQSVSPTSTTTYTATATGAQGNATKSVTVTVVPAGSLQSINHVIFEMQENRSFDSYFGMLNPYRQANKFSVGADGNTYAVDGIDDKLSKISNTNDNGVTYPLFKFTSTCIDDMSSAWLESYGDVNTYDFSADRPIQMGGFVHTAEGFANNCNSNGGCSGNFTDTNGQRAMGYYDQGFLNYYYYMASQFALSDRWFSPVSSKTVDNRIATFTGGTTQGITKDPGSDDNVGQLDANNIFEELDQANVSWKIYYTVNQGDCLDEDDCPNASPADLLPATDFDYLSYANQYLYENPSGAACVPPTVGSQAVGDSTNSFCIDTNHIAPLSQYYSDLTNGTLPSFSFIEAGFGNNDEHPGSGQEILSGQAEMSHVIGALMSSSSWKDSVFFMAFDEDGGPYDHVPPVPGHTNDNTDATVGSASVSSYPDISTIAVNPDGYNPCLPPNPGTAVKNAGGGYCDLFTDEPGAVSTDAAANPDNVPAGRGFSAQLGFRVPNMVISPFVRQHYVSHIPMDHTAIIKFVESRFIGASTNLTARDAVQPNLLDFFDFTNVPWATPPTPPTPVSDSTLGYNSCTPTKFAP